MQRNRENSKHLSSGFDNDKNNFTASSSQSSQFHTDTDNSNIVGENEEQQLQIKISPIGSRPEKRKKHDQLGLTLRTAKIFYDPASEQFIEAKQTTSKNKNNLNFSAQLVYENMVIILHNEGCLMQVDNDLVAKVEILQPNLIEEAENFEDAKNILMGQLQIVSDFSGSLAEVKSNRKTLLLGLENELAQSSVSEASRFSSINLYEIIEALSKSKLLSNSSVCQEIANAQFLSDELKRQAVIVEEGEKSFKGLRAFKKIGLFLEDDSQYLYQSLRQLLTKSVKRHTDVLCEIVPYLKDAFPSVSEEKLSLITMGDVKLFADMASVLNMEIFSDPLLNLQQRWIQYIKMTEIDQLKKCSSTTNKSYLFLCKSLEEIITQISEITNIPEWDFLKVSSSGWQKRDKINWKNENVSTKCLEKQYKFLFRLLDHFDLTKTCYREPFKYNINDEPSDIPEEIRVWHYLLCDTLEEIVPKDCSIPIIESAIQRYLKLLSETKLDELEIVRMATHNTIQFIAQVVPNISSGSNKSKYNTFDTTLKIAGKFSDSTGEQFIDTRIPSSKGFQNLNFSAQLVYEDMEIVLHNEGCLMQVDNDLVAKVEILQPSQLEETKNFEDAKNFLLGHLRIVSDLSGSMAEITSNRNALLSGLEKILTQSSVDEAIRLASIELYEIVEKLHISRMPNNFCVCQEIDKASFLSDELKIQAAIVEEGEKSFKGMRAFQKFGLLQEDDSQYLYQSLRQLLTKSVERHKDVLFKIAPNHLRNLLSGVSEEKLIYITENDVKLFADMASVLNMKIFMEPLHNLLQRWAQHIELIGTDQLKLCLTTTNKVFFFLCKSLDEIITQISENNGFSEWDPIHFNSTGWQKKDPIIWEEENVTTKCLEQQYNFLFRLLDHFDFGKSCNRKSFEYNINEEIRNIPEEIRVWHYLLCDTLEEIVPKDCSSPIIDSAIQRYLKLLSETKLDELEIVRMATHNTIQFIAQVVPNITSGSHNLKYNTFDSTLKIAGKFSDSTGEQFIETRIPTSKCFQNLNFSAQLVHKDMEIVLHNEGCLMQVDNDLVAKVEIVQPSQLEEAKNFEDAKCILLCNIQIVKILANDSLAKIEQNRKPLLLELENILRNSTIDGASRQAFIELSGIVENLDKTGISCNSSVCKAIEEATFPSEELKRLAASIDDEEKNCDKREQAFQKLGLQPTNDRTYLYQGLLKLLNENNKRQADFLNHIVSDSLRKVLNSVNEKKLVFVTENDINIFADMANVLNDEIFAKPLQHLQQRWVNKINSVDTSHRNCILPTMNKIYFFLCKSLEELIIQISNMTDIPAATLLECSSCGWEKMDQIRWKKENVLTKCLERLYSFIFRLLDHFDLEKSYKRQPFMYNLKMFNNSKKINVSSFSSLKNFIVSKPAAKNMSQVNLSGIPEELCVWYYLLDDALVHVLPKDYDHTLVENLLQSFLKLVRETKHDQMEVLRVATHNTIQFIVEIVPYMSPSSDVSSVDRRILHTQFDKISSQLSNTCIYRDLVNVFGSYWRVRSEVISNIKSRIPHPKIDLLKDELLNIVLVVMEKSVENENLLAFLRTYEEFFTDLKEVNYDWFIKSIPNVDMQVYIRRKRIEVADNKLKDTPNITYRVVDAKEFIEFCKSQTVNASELKHYVIEVLQKLLSLVSSQLQRNKWALEGELSTADQLSSTCELVSTIHHSLLYLKEQADYVSFEKFYTESVDPFISLIEKSESRKDFSTRVHLLRESFWFIRKQNEIDVETVLQLYKKLNPNLDSEKLKLPYEEYLTHFENFIKMTVEKDYTTAVTLIAKEVNELVPKNKHFKTWDSDFKQHKVPQILAGLGAVWSILVSKDVSSAGRYLSPNCVQILCVLRLLSVDKSTNGIDKHLAQVLTGQGKSLILALVAALLALTGHEIDIGCYSRYLVERDQESFKDFYTTLNVTDVTYDSLTCLMEKFINPEVDGKTTGLRELVQNIVSDEKTSQSNKCATHTFQNSILLVDEVDVFFSNKFYRNIYRPITLCKISGIDKIQEFIWKTVSGGDSNVGSITNKVKKLIESSTFLQKGSFQTFRSSNKHCKLLTRNGEVKSYTNQSLLDEHLEEMVAVAIDVYNSPESKWSNFKLNSLGQITKKVSERYETDFICGYFNTFNYFRLKKKSFVTQIDKEYNYGYLKLDCGFLSYAMLPLNYPLILGISGTLANLNDWEKQTIDELYNIKQLTAMPTFYGRSNLRFDETKNFYHFSTKSSWRKHIFSQSSKAVVANRAVLIFFDNDLELNAFKSEYGGQLDRLNELTENTVHKEKCINEAGIAKMITLATREMGRGVDYKTSLLVEKHGGVHVIQTFFSMDVKEETQIKGRTARQDNKGSYELAVCYDDLEKCELVSDENYVSYSTLATNRIVLNNETNKSILNAIEKNKVSHNATMDYIKSFLSS